MKVLIIGASGTAGNTIVKKALSKNLELVAYVRSPEKLNHIKGNIKVIKGDIKDIIALSKVMYGIDTVISCVGAMDNSPGQVELFRSGMENIVLAMKNKGIKRLISINGALTKLSTDKVGLYLKMMRWVIPKLVPEMINSNKAQYEVITQSELDWTVIRAGKFSDKSGTGKISVNLTTQKGFSIGITKKDLADFVIKQISETEYIRKSPMVFSK